MPRDVNPFEPWRPPQVGDKPPEVNPERPWRPPGPEPIPVARPAPQARPARRLPAPPPAPARRPPVPAKPLRPDQAAVRTMLFLLVVTGLILTAVLGSEHLFRVFVGCLSLGLGWVVGVSWARRRPNAVRLGWVVAGVAGAVAARWFVPTATGDSLWNASHTAAALEALPADDIGLFSAGAARRKAAARNFPEYATDIAEAERAWLDRCADTAIFEAKGRKDTEPAQASARLGDCERALGRLPQAAEASKKVHEARREVLDARAKLVRAELELLADHGKFAKVAETARQRLEEMDAEVRELNAAEEVRQELAPPRARALQARLEAARTEARDLLAKERFQAVASLGEGLARTLDNEAEAVGSAAELKKFCDSCRVVGDLARQAGKKD
jgi:hypothetical protein